MKFAIALAFVCLPVAALAQGLNQPYGAPEHQWATPPAGGPWGSSAGIERGPHGEIWAIDRCGANSCDGSDKAPIVELDMATGKAIKASARVCSCFPTACMWTASGNVWVTDGAISKDGSKGLQVIELSPDGKVLMQLGHRRPARRRRHPFPVAQRCDHRAQWRHLRHRRPCPHRAASFRPGLDMRVMKFDSHGKFIKQWGKAGSGPGEFNNPHALAFDGKGRLFVADRANNRIQIFSQDGKLLDEWKQFGRPSGFYIAGDRLYAIDADSTRSPSSGLEEGRVDRQHFQGAARRLCARRPGGRRRGCRAQWQHVWRGECRAARHHPVSQTVSFKGEAVMSDSRRNFLLKSFSASSAAWLAANWPAQVAAAEKAQAMGAFTYFTREQAADVDAMAAQIYPTTDTPGASEAQVIYFIDLALVTFAQDKQDIYAKGLADLAGQTGGRALCRAAADQQIAGSDRDRKDAVLPARCATTPSWACSPRPSMAATTTRSAGSRSALTTASISTPPFGAYDKA